MHDEIIRYSLVGEIQDSNIVESKKRLVSFVEGRMRDEGCAPALDLEPQFTLDYKPERETYEFSLSVYGVYIGEEAWQNAGMMNGKTIMLSTAQVRSKES